MFSGVAGEHAAICIDRFFMRAVKWTEIPGTDLMKRVVAVLCAAFVILGFTSAVWAQTTLRVGVDKAHVLRLDKDAATIMLANPAIADVAVENSRLIFLLGRTTGETNLIILDRDGREILSSAVVVVPTRDRQVSIFRSMIEFTKSCDPRCAPIPNPGSRPAAAVSSGQQAEDDEGAGSAPALAPEDIAAAAASAAAAALAEQAKEGQAPD
jgi:hypothetical protein